MFSTPNLSFTLFLYFTLLIIHPSTQCHIDDENALLAFKSGIVSDPSEMLKSWEPNTDCCQWAGITCNDNPDNERVTALYINGHAPEGNTIFSGRISASLGNLKYLNALGLSDLGNLTGPFPEFIFTLPSLTTLAITNNKLYGRIPRAISNMTHLRTLNLSGNWFSGILPSSLGTMPQLLELDLSDNRLSGALPTSFNRLRVIILNLSTNQFTGPLPEYFFNADLIRSLILSNNKFTGELPQFGLGYQWMESMNLSNNQFSGGVPEWYGTLEKISTLDLSHNKLNGSSFPQIKHGVSKLDLSYNNFRFGSIPKWIGNQSMEYLGMAKCGINIKLNDWKPIAATYKKIDLSENNITGSPLPFLNSKVDLEGFWASKNKMKYDMIHMKVGNLKSLDLSNNLAFGAVPKTVWRLNELNVSYNHLCGELPATKFPVSSFVGNDCLCGDPLPPRG